jgi:hypothetical protein
MPSPTLGSLNVGLQFVKRMLIARVISIHRRFMPV